MSKETTTEKDKLRTFLSMFLIASGIGLSFWYLWDLFLGQVIFWLVVVLSGFFAFFGGSGSLLTGALILLGKEKKVAPKQPEQPTRTLGEW